MRNFIIILIIGAVLNIGADWLMGIRWTDVHLLARTAHIAFHVLWGAIIALSLRKVIEKES